MKIYVSMSFSICVTVLLQYLEKQHQVELCSMQIEDLKEILEIIIYKGCHWVQPFKIIWKAYAFFCQKEFPEHLIYVFS